MPTKPTSKKKMPAVKAAPAAKKSPVKKDVSTAKASVEVISTPAAKPVQGKPVVSAVQLIEQARMEGKSVVAAETFATAKVPVLKAKAVSAAHSGSMHDAIIADGFKFVATADAAGGIVAHGYSHKDGRAVLVSVTTAGKEAWTLRAANGDESGGKDAVTLATALSMRPSRAELASQPKPPAGPPVHVVRAIEMLGGVTTQRYDLDTLKGDKNYGRRVALLKKLLQTDKVLVADSGFKVLETAFYSAVGAEGKNAVAKTKDFALRCRAIVTASRAAAAAAKKAQEAATKAAKAATRLERTVPGTILEPPPKPKTKAERAAELESVKEDLSFHLTVSESTHPIPKADVEVEIIPGDVGLLEDPNNGIVMLQIEKENSQGAVAVYNNGTRVSAGVISLETLKTLRAVPGEQDLIMAARQLLNPLVPSVPVSPAAARLLNQVIHCKELIPMATKKTAEVAVAKSSKFKAPEKAATKATKPAKTEKPAKAPKAAKTDAAPRKAFTYRLLNASKKLWESWPADGQKGVLIKALVKAGAVGAKAAGVTAAALAASTGVPEKNVAFYMSTWQGTKKQDQVVIEKIAAV